MVVGEAGLGKSTLVNALFLTDLYPERVIPDATGKLNSINLQFPTNNPFRRKNDPDR